MAAQAVEYFVLLTVAGTQAEDEENYIVLFSWAVISKSRNQVGIISIKPHLARFGEPFCIKAYNM